MIAKQSPFKLKDAGKRDVRSQFGALPYRIKNGKVQVLLITSRGTGRWIMPKGWPMDGATATEAAEVEAYEEAGVVGRAHHQVLGFYSYTKEHEGEKLPIVVAVFPVKVRKLLSEWPEKDERKRKWVGRKKAAKLLDDKELRVLVRHFNPRGF